MSTINHKNFPEAFEPIAKKEFNDGLAMKREIEGRKEMFYKTHKSSKNEETSVEIGDIGIVPEFTGVLEYQSLQQGYKKVITSKEYAYGIRIERRFMTTDQIGVIGVLVKSLGLSMRRRISADVVSPFNNAFNTTFTARDGLSLCNAAHTSNVGGSNQSNILTTAFSPVALSAAVIAHKKILTNADQVMNIISDMVVGPIDLMFAMKEVNDSSHEVNTANNTINVHKGKFTMVNDRLITDSNNWFLIDSNLMKEFGLMWYDVTKPEFGRDKEFDTFVSKWRVYAMYGFSPVGWEWVFGSEVS